MDPKVKAEWLTALRSGDYAQAKHSLRSILNPGTPEAHDGYCCLGVLAHITTGKDESLWKLSVFSPDAYIFIPGGVSNVSRPTYYEKAGVTSDQAWTLSGMNDNGKSFTEIADYIEANL